VNYSHESQSAVAPAAITKLSALDGISIPPDATKLDLQYLATSGDLRFAIKAGDVAPTEATMLKLGAGQIYTFYGLKRHLDTIWVKGDGASYLATIPIGGD
jgi:hypothetical protein